MADAHAVLRSLHGRLPLALITNGSTETQWDTLRGTGLETRLQAVLVSGEVGVAKPDAAIFHLARAKLGVAAESVWHVGDNLYSAVRSADEPQPDLEIASLTELLEHLA